jgi:hypothetical protein
VDTSTEPEKLIIQLAALEKALTVTRKELLDSRARLALISRLVQDDSRARRAPGVVFGAIRAALFCETRNLKMLSRRLPARRSI